MFQIQGTGVHRQECTLGGGFQDSVPGALDAHAKGPQVPGHYTPQQPAQVNARRQQPCLPFQLQRHDQQTQVADLMFQMYTVPGKGLVVGLPVGRHVNAGE